jgi:hypothetical protein
MISEHKTLHLTDEDFPEVPYPDLTTNEAEERLFKTGKDAMEMCKPFERQKDKYFDLVLEAAKLCYPNQSFWLQIGSRTGGVFRHD